jgi:hypothetical protein
MQQEPLESLEEISEVFKFEHWLRFYFIEENKGVLRINLDDRVMEKMEQEYGHLAALASTLNRIELDPVVSRQVIVEYLLDHFDGKKYEIGYIPKLLDSNSFKAEIELFNAWTHLYEDQLDKTTLSFAKWKDLYGEWKKSESAKKIGLSLSMHGGQQNGQVQSKKTN